MSKHTFHSPFDQYKARNGQSCVVLGPVDPASYDADECGPLWDVQFDDGERIQAWPDELQPPATPDN